MKVAIIGAGAAGCFAAANIPYREGREVVIFEKTGKALQKVKVSGGGRCNTTHHLFDIPELTNKYPRGKQLLRKTLYRFGPEQTIAWFKERGVDLKTEADGRMFPISDSSQTIIDCLWQQLMRNKVIVRYHKSVNQVAYAANIFRIHFADNTTYEADKLIIACGGFPKEEQYNWLKTLGHEVKAPVPSLFTFNIPKHPITELMGISVPYAGIKIAGTKITETGPLLITHWGLSGPVVLRTSAWGALELSDLGYDFTVLVNWLGDTKETDLRETFTALRQEQGKQFIQQKNPFELPKRLWDFLLSTSGILSDTRWGECPAAAQNKLIESLLRQSFHVTGKTTFKEEFVTCGGVALNSINAQTMESRLIPGLYFAGEILDVDGITGGFNFQHAWASGWIAAGSIADIN